MNIKDILSEIDAEIARLQQAKALLGNTAPATGVVAKRKPGRPPASAKAFTTVPVTKAKKRRTMSPEGRAKIAAAQKARWAKTKKAAKPVIKKKVGRPAKTAGKKASAVKKAEGATASA